MSGDTTEFLLLFMIILMVRLEEKSYKLNDNKVISLNGIILFIKKFNIKEGIINYIKVGV